MKPLSLSLLRSPLTAAILDGRIDLGVGSLDLHEADSIDRNTRRMLGSAFDVAEMSFATFVWARVTQGFPARALPVFTGRRFTHALVACRPGAGIDGPSGLAGRRVAIPQYWMTSSVWHRGVLSGRHGIDPASICWVTTGEERTGDVCAPAGVRTEAAQGGRALIELLRTGDVDCVMGPRPYALTGESSALPLYRDVVAAQRDYFAETGVFPIMHLVVVRAELEVESPGLIAGLLELFHQAKEMAGRQSAILGASAHRSLRLLGHDPWVYGLRANRSAVETLVSLCHEQGLVTRSPSMDELFVKFDFAE